MAEGLSDVAVLIEEAGHGQASLGRFGRYGV